MKCIHCKEKIAKNEPRCSKCGKEIDEDHWSMKVYKKMSAFVFWINIALLLGGGIFLGWVTARNFSYEIFNGNTELKRFFVISKGICLFIQLGGFLVHLFTSPIVLYSLYERKWNWFVSVVASIMTVLYGFNLAFVIVHRIFGEYSLIGVISSALVFAFTFAMLCVALAGARRIRARKKRWKKKVKQITGEDDEDIINCEKCGADLPKDTEICPVCGKNITLFDIDVPDNLAIWCATLVFRINGSIRRLGEDPLFIGGYKGVVRKIVSVDMYTHNEYNLPSDTTKSYMCDFAGRAMVWSLLFCLFFPFARRINDSSWDWIAEKGSISAPVFIPSVIACVVVLIATCILSKYIMKAINHKEWDKNVTKKLLISLGIRVAFSAVLVYFMLFLDVRVMLTIPFIVYLCVTQIVLLILSRSVKKRIELYNTYAEKIIEKGRGNSVTSSKYKNRRYMNLD